MVEFLWPLLIGAAAVFDTVFLLAMLERRNWSTVRSPIVLMMLGAWLWHVGQFCLLLLTDLPGRWPWYVASACMTAMAGGLLLMPCGLIHGAWRVSQSRLDALPVALKKHAFAYVPLLLLVPLTGLFFRRSDEDFETLTGGVALIYVAFACGTDLVAAVVFWRVRGATGTLAGGERLNAAFFANIAIVFVCKAALKVVFVIVRAVAPEWASAAMLVLSLSPLAPMLLFAYFVIRYQFLQVVLEQSLVYGAILGGIILLHQVAFQDVSAALPEGYRLHIAILETAAVAALILVYRPLRERSAEALRYLLGARMSEIRERLRKLSRDLSGQTGRSPAAVLEWFVPRLQDVLHVEYACCWLFNDRDEAIFHAGADSCWPRERAAWLMKRMREEDQLICSRRHSANRQLLDALHESRAGLAIAKARTTIGGLLILGRAKSGRELSDEETHAVALLVEQLAITLENNLLQSERLAAERRAMQHEKLSTMGLLAGSLAHEIKNPLSAIKTIATVLAEDLGPGSDHAQDLRLILGEVDRLSKSTNQLLAIGRPRRDVAGPTCLTDVLKQVLQLLRHLANQRNIQIETSLPDELPRVRADEAALWEIFFNLLSNSLEAAGTAGRIQVDASYNHGAVVTTVRDSGPGIPEEIRARLFEPFQSTKEAGTGLGLYVVGRHVAELGGVIRCQSGPTGGTAFTVELPAL